MNYQVFIPRKVVAENSKRSNSSPERATSIFSQVLFSKGYDSSQRLILTLYDNWEEALGDELAAIALPIGRRGKVLLVGAEDNFVMSELAYMREELLEKANKYLGGDYLEKIEIHLLQGRRALNQEVELHKPAEKLELILPDNIGKLNLPEGKVKDYYMRYLEALQKNN